MTGSTCAKVTPDPLMSSAALELPFAVALFNADLSVAEKAHCSS